MNNHVVEARNLVKYFPVKSGLIFGRTIGYVQAVNDVSFVVQSGETFALVGESGCGKTTIANLILKLLEPTSGEILFQGKSLNDLTAAETTEYRKSVQAVLQDPYGALNPRMRVGHVIGEPLEVHGFSRSERNRKIKDALRAVGLPETSDTQFPHEFSGGQRQRIGVARALTLEPTLMILDEPVSNLDVSIRSQVLNLLKDIQDERGISYILISHDLASVEHMSHTIGVMYLGKLVELGGAEEICSDPSHPYTASLVAAATPVGRTPNWQIPIVGEVPSALETPSGCAFHPRCAYAMPVCSQDTPPLTQLPNGRWVACHLYPDHIGSIDKSTPPPAPQQLDPILQDDESEANPF
ncbi:MAG: ABC transporter ATP-binding protein [Dehalococcoidia bacterium]